MRSIYSVSVCILLVSSVATPTISQTLESTTGPKLKHSRPQSTQSLPTTSMFQPPPANACASLFDQFYSTEPGVYAYWPLCETGAPPQFFDYVGEFDLTAANSTWGSGTISSNSVGPVSDGEPAASVATATGDLTNQNIPINPNQGAIAAWVKADATPHTVNAVALISIGGSSEVNISVNSKTSLCFDGIMVNSAGTKTIVEKCGFTANAWYRVVFSWNKGTLTLFVNGYPVASGACGTLSTALYYYRIFPGCCDTGKPMSLAKVLVANQVWAPSQVLKDYKAVLPPIPPGGLYTTTQSLGTIHKDVLGVADFNEDISTDAQTAVLLSGFTAAGISAVRYAGGTGGILADRANWQEGLGCGADMGSTAPAINGTSSNNLSTFFSKIASKLQLDMVYTVNYGTNPPYCNAGGDPVANASSLVQYANLVNRYGIRRWEIGNEVFAASTEADFHPGPHTGASYATYEQGFYKAMKVKDAGIEIGVPIGLSNYGWQTGFDLPVLAGAAYDAVVWHDYPILDPITDGSTLYQDRVASHVRRTRSSLLKIQTELLAQGKARDAIWVTEWDGEVGGNKPSRQSIGAVEPLFAAIQLAEFMTAGVRIATYWTQGYADVCTNWSYDNSGEGAYSWYDCGASGMVYNGPFIGHGEVSVGMKPGDLFPVGRAFQVLAQSGFVTEGEHMLRTYSDETGAPWLMSYSATHGSSVALLLINRDRDVSHVAPIKLQQLTTGQSIDQWTYGRLQYDDTQTGNWSDAPVHSSLGPWSGSTNVTLPPWSINVIVFNK